ncbi:MAG: hypothetical protein IBX68_10195, partial [Dehalococcoidia bacterium]|nr:hypothetical protein [Dehalococcoidia bacterium]
LSGYAFWTAVVLLIGLAVGMVTTEAGKHRRRSEALLRERTLLLERQRLSHELHDSVLKTLHGLALEARALRNRTGIIAGCERKGAVH